MPGCIIVTARLEASLAEMRHVHSQIGFGIPIDYRLAAKPEDADVVVGTLPARFIVVNATGLGKDGTGAPLTHAVCFPDGGLIWEFNYRGDLVFLDQARVQVTTRNLTVHDGWVYFIHGWTRVIAEVFDIDIPMSGPAFEAPSQITKDANS